MKDRAHSMSLRNKLPTKRTSLFRRRRSTKAFFRASNSTRKICSQSCKKSSLARSRKASITAPKPHRWSSKRWGSPKGPSWRSPPSNGHTILWRSAEMKHPLSVLKLRDTLECFYSMEINSECQHQHIRKKRAVPKSAYRQPWPP